MKLNLRQQITQFAHVLQSQLFPILQDELGELTPSAKRLVAALDVDDRKAAHPERAGPIDEKSAVVGTAMTGRVTHRCERRRIDIAAIESKKTENSTHDYTCSA